MKQILLLGALLVSTTVPVYAAPSDADMGFSPSKEDFGGSQPTARDVGAAGLQTRGNGGGGISSMDPYGSASRGDSGNAHSTEKLNEGFYWGDQGNMNQWQSRNGNSGKIFFGVADHGKEAEGGSKKSTSHQHGIQQMVKPQTNIGLMAPLSSGSHDNFGVALWNDKGGPYGSGTPTPNAIRLFHWQANPYTLPKTGLAGVNASICSPNGKGE